MRKFIFLIVIVSFVFWLLPLGAFIKPSAEKFLCAGRRAICLCHYFAGKAPQKGPSAATLQTSGAGTPKEEGAGAATNHQFLMGRFIQEINRTQPGYFVESAFLYKYLFLRSIEHIPKA